MRRLTLEYGDGVMEVEVPDSTVVVQPGETHTEPAPVANPVEETQAAIRHPLGSRPIRDRVGPGARVVIAFPDRVKGGFHDTAHRRVAIPILLEELAAAGVREQDITLICATGLHRKNHEREFEAYLGPDIVRRFRGHRLVNHDAEDREQTVDLGETEVGDVVEVNRALVEADLAIMIGHTMGNPYGGYSGGYKMPTTGLTTWRSIRCHHTPSSMHRADFVPITTESRFRGQLAGIGRMIESAMKAPFFAVDAVLNGESKQLGVFAGAVPDVEQASWPLARRRTEIELDEPADALVLGMPRSFHYGPGMGSNPILMLQAIGASIARARGALRPGAVVICASVCDGWFNDQDFAPYRDVFDRFQRVSEVDEMRRYEDELASRPDLIDRYRFAYAYHPFHAFSMLYMGWIAHREARAIYIAGARVPGYARAMGAIPKSTFEAALRDARRFVGENPRLLVVPALSRPAVHVGLASGVTPARAS